MPATHPKRGDEIQNNLSQSVSKIKLLAGLTFFICVAVFIIHLPGLDAKALSVDDNEYLTENQLIQNPSLASAKRFLTEVIEPSTVQGYYQPLAMISLMIDYTLGGREENPKAFHRTSLVLHIANTALIIILLYMLFGQAIIAAGAGLLFGLHPMTVEPICWISDRKTLLAAFFALWSLVFYIRYTKRQNWLFFTGCIVTYLLALMSKPTSLPLPAVMLLIDYWPLDRLKVRAVAEKIPLFVLGGIFALITYISQSRTAGAALPTEYGPQRIVLVLCHNIIFYLNKIIWPINLSPSYLYPKPFSLSEPMVLASVIGTCVLIGLLLVSLRFTRALFTGWLIFFVSIFPTMGVVSFTYVIAADKFAYLPSVGLLMILAWALTRLCATDKPKVKPVTIAIIILFLAFGESVGTRRYLRFWRSSESLYKHILLLTPNSVVAHNNLGLTLQTQGNLDEAANHFQQAIQAEPNYAEAHNNLGTILVQREKLNQAAEFFRQAIKIRPDYASAHYNLANILQSQGKLDEAIGHFQLALQKRPDFDKAHNNLALALQFSGKLNEAITHFKLAVKIKPDSAGIYYNLGTALKQQGEINEAINSFRRAVQINPNYIGPLSSLAKILANHPDPNIRNAKEAIDLAEHGVKLTNYKNLTLLNTLSTAYATDGQFDKAIEITEFALDLALEDKNQKLADSIRRQIQTYEQAKSNLKTQD